MPIKKSLQKLYHQISEYIEQDATLKAAGAHQNYFEIKRGNTTCLCRLKQKATLTIELYCNNQKEYWVYYNILEIINGTPQPHAIVPVATDLGSMLEDLNKKVQLVNSFHIPEDLKEVKEACCYLLDLYDQASEVMHKRRFIHYSDGKEMTKEELQEYVNQSGLTADLQKELILSGKMGITCPSGKRKGNDNNPFKSCIWVDEDSLDKVPRPDISAEYWTPDWKSTSDGSVQYWVLVAAPKYWSFSGVKINEEFTYSLRNEKGNARQKQKCFAEIAEGDKVVCYEADPTRGIVAFAEVVAASDGDKITLRKTEELKEVLNREKILSSSVLEKLFNYPQFSLSDMTKEQYEVIRELVSSNKAESVPHPHNRILFGAPGTGKSFHLKNEAEKYFSKTNPERVTFHPEYSYYDFVGSYKPVMEGVGKDERIKYRFVPGPFAIILKQALKHPYGNYLLVIEEINRARVAAVFGDMFQLLDRKENGESEYGITPSEELRKYLELPQGEKVVLPGNLYLWATMNSADQGVYPMDTAFKRRWSFEYLGIDNSEDKLEGKHAETWKRLRRGINQLLQQADINEDKQMGPFFLNKKELNVDEAFKSSFMSKVLMYLYEDAARHKRNQVFRGQSKLRYSELCQKFNDCDFNNPDEILKNLFGLSGESNE